MARRALTTFVVGTGVFAVVVATQALLGTNPAGAAGLMPYRDCDEFLAQQRTDLRQRTTAYGLDGAGASRATFGVPAAALQSFPQMASAESLGFDSASSVKAQDADGGTGTNVQERGVDEPDLAKLADGRMVVVNDSRLVVLSTGRTPQVIGRLDLPAEPNLGYGTELLLTGDRAVVIRPTYREVTVAPVPVPSATPTPAATTPAPTPPTSVAPTPSPTATLVPTPVPPPVTSSPTATASTEPAPAPTSASEPGFEGAGAAPSSGQGSTSQPSPGQAVEPLPVEPPATAPEPPSATPPSPTPPTPPRTIQVPATRVILIDLSATKPRIIEQRVQDGEYISARLVDGTVRVVTRSWPALIATDPWTIDPTLMSSPDDRTARAAEATALRTNQRIAETAPLSAFLPQFSRIDGSGTTLESGDAVSCDDVAHAAEGLTGGMVTVTTLRPSSGLAATDTDAVATTADTVYAAPDRLYIATSRWPVGVMTAASTGFAPVSSGGATTELHAFDTSTDDSTTYVASGSVPGSILGRWALSLHEGTLRVATTTDPMSGGVIMDEPVLTDDVVPADDLVSTDDALAPDAPVASDSEGAAVEAPEPTVPTSQSMLVKLEEQGDRLVETGRVTGLGKGERITAVRYFGDLATVVTFRRTDPLYLVDLSGQPTVTGELKIPGYSTYLHPVGDDLLIGLGYDGDYSGTITGLQVSTFDVSDRSAPRLVDRQPVGLPMTRGDTSSAAVEESRAFTYDAQRRLLLLPLTTYDYSDLSASSAGPSASVLGVAVGVDGALSAAGSLSVTGGGDTVMRVLLDGDAFHAVAANGVTTGDATTFAALTRVTYP